MQETTYQLTLEQLNSVTDVEMAFATERLLPSWEQIPDDFKRGNKYTALVEALFYGTELPKYDVVLNDGVEGSALNKCIRAHLQSFGPKHEHKIAGVGLMVASLCTLVAPES